jgi:hypothetical protein
VMEPILWSSLQSHPKLELLVIDKADGGWPYATLRYIVHELYSLLEVVEYEGVIDDDLRE